MMQKMERRAFLAAAPAPLLARMPVLSAPLSRQGLTAFLTARVDAMAKQWDAKRDAIRTAAGLEARNRDVRSKVREMLGPLPPPAPLRAEITGILQRDGYRIEKLLLESRPGLWVTANVYVPPGPGPFPAVLSPCGHYELARMHPDYQLAYIDLALQGLIVLAYDPPGQGERRNYWNRTLGANEEGLRSVDDHSMAGHLLLLLGDSLTGYMVQDGLRAIDYLLMRPDVDARKIACAGHSGGGTLTMFLACVDERLACAVINEGGTAHRWPVTLRSDGSPPVPDAEQNLFPAAVYGIDTCDMHAAIAPRPLLALIEEYAEPFNRSAAHIRARYELLNAGARFETAEAKARHAWTAKLRLATADWCSRWFLGRPGPAAEPGRQPEPPAILHVTPEGSLREAGKGETLFAHIAARAAAIDDARLLPITRPDLAAFQKDLRKRLPRLLRIDLPSAPARFRVAASAQEEGLFVESCEIDSEPGVVLDAIAYRPNSGAVRPRPVLLVATRGRTQVEPAARALAAAGFPVLCLNPRGIAWQQPAAAVKPYGHLFDTTTGQAYLAWSLDQDLFGMRVFDVLSAAAAAPGLLKTRAPLSVCAWGDAVPWVLCAAALEPGLSKVVCREGLVSWRALLSSDRYSHGAGVFVRGIFPHWDLPQFAGALAPRRLVVSSPVGALRQPVSTSDHLSWTRSAYACCGAQDRFLTPPEAVDQPFPARLSRWLT